MSGRPVRSDSEKSTQSDGTDGSTDSNDLSVVAEFDELMRLEDQKRNDEVEDLFIAYIEFAQSFFENFLKIESENVRLQQELDSKIQEFTDLESKLTAARMLVDKERKNTRKALKDKHILEQQLKQIKDVVAGETGTRLSTDIRERLALLSNVNSERGFPDLSAIPEGNTTGSLLSDFSYSRSGGDDDTKDMSGWDYRRSVGQADEPAVKKRRSSQNKVVEISTVDKVRATTTLMVPKEGPITATSVIEAIPSTDRFHTPSKQVNSNTEQERVNCNRNEGRVHSLNSKITVIPENCTVCEKKVGFGKMAFRCKECRAVCHLECKDALPLPCVVSVGTPSHKGTISDFVPLTSPMVPALIVHCVKEVETKGLEEIGIYRVPGSEREVKLLKEKFLRGRGSPSLTQTDVHVICGTIKCFLRSLVEPLITYAKWNDFVSATQKEDLEKVATDLKKCVESLPQPNRDTLAFMMLHFKRVSQASKCKMPASNLAKVFGPAIVGYSSADPSPQSLLHETRLCIEVMERLLNLPEDFFEDLLSHQLKPNGSPCESPLRPAHMKIAPSSSSKKIDRKRQIFGLSSSSHLPPMSSESPIRPISNDVFIPTIRRVVKRKQRYFPSPTS